MPRFAPDPSTVVIGFPVYPKGRYNVQLGEPKSFYGAGKNGKADNHGVRFAGKIADGEFVGKPFMIQCFMHTPESEGFSKMYQMAALGYNPSDKQEQVRFNTEKGHLDWSYDTDTQSAGDAWHEMKGKVIVFDLDTDFKDGAEVQKTVKVSAF